MIAQKFMKRFFEEARQQSRIAIPTSLGMLLYRIPWIISLHFVGILGPDELAAAALATTLCNITGLSLSVGLSSALSTLTAQAKGDLFLKGMNMKKDVNLAKCREYNNDDCVEETEEDSNLELVDDEDGRYHYEENVVESSLLLPKVDEKARLSNASITHEVQNLSCDHDFEIEKSPLQPLVILYRGMAIQLALVIPIGLWWISGLKPFLLALGQVEELAGMTERYLRVLTPGLWAYSINITLSSWLQSIGIANVPAYAALVGFLSHIPFNILFVDILGYGYLGVAMATVLFQVLQPIIICAYIFGTTRGRQHVLEGMGATRIGRMRLGFGAEARCAITSMYGVKQYLSLALPGIVIISEWWASEFIIFMSGRLHPNPESSLSATSIYQTINTFFFMFPVGFSAAASARVGLFLGMNKASEAKMASRVSVCFAGILSACMGSLLMYTPHELFPSIFTDDERILRIAASTMPFLAFYVFADGVQVALNGIIKGCGRQSVVAPIVIFAYWVVAVPLAYYNSFDKYGGTTTCHDSDITCGVRGLVSAMTVGTWTHFLLCFWVVIYLIRWDEEARKARERTQGSK